MMMLTIFLLLSAAFALGDASKRDIPQFPPDFCLLLVVTV